ncbi:Kv channel-interacting 2-like protein [Labeo rohita]|uniref:Kv channel-interacting 2-like protein n=1 Tax=Labeo rohita TaxID=84645 RepID=A0A498NZ12_LABRO|nr:Kv channel-interacting 2-like protein [Labeo rohita]
MSGDETSGLYVLMLLSFFPLYYWCFTEESTEDDFEISFVCHRPDDLDILQEETEFSKKELQFLYRAFKNECPSGVVTEDVFKLIYSQFFPQGDSSIYAHYLFEAFDTNRNGCLSFKEFVAGLSLILRGSIYDRLNWAFHFYDLDKDGFITREEMMKIMKSIYVLMGKYVYPSIHNDTPKEHVENFFQVVKENVRIPVYVMIRPRAGDFLYSDWEVEVMKRDIEQMKIHRADGLVFGALTEDGRVDTELCMELLAASRPLPVTFHRGGGITERNLQRILEGSGSQEFHCSARSSKDSTMKFSAALEKVDAPDTVDLMRKRFGPKEAVKITVEILRKMNQNHVAEQLEDKHKQGSSCVHYSCEAIDCQEPLIRNAEVQCSDGGYFNGARCTVTCNSGYVLQIHRDDDIIKSQLLIKNGGLEAEVNVSSEEVFVML